MSGLTQQELKTALDYDTVSGVFTWKKTIAWAVGTRAGSLHHTGRRYIRIKRKQYADHQLAFLFVHGYIPKEIDHIDMDKTNCAIANLRACSRSLNKANQHKYSTNTSGYKGVHLHNGRWVARIGVDYKRIFLGNFNTPEEAHVAYTNAAKTYFGSFAREV